MYKVRVIYIFKNDIMFSWFQYSIFKHIERKYTTPKLESKLSKAKEKLYHKLFDVVLSDMDYLINKKKWAKYEIKQKDKGGEVTLDINYPKSEKASYKTFQDIHILSKAYLKALSRVFEIKIVL